MRIGFFVYEYPPAIVGGLGIYAENITQQFIKDGHEVIVFTQNPGNLKTKQMLNGVEVHRPLLVQANDVFPFIVTDDLRRWGTNISYFSDLFIYNILSSAKLINNLIKQNKYDFDIFCVHDWLSSIAGNIIKKELEKIPMVFHVHSTEWGRSGGKGSEVVSHLEDQMAKKADHVITVSNAMREDLIKHGWMGKKISYIWNGVNPNRYNPKNVKDIEVKKIREKYGISNNEKMILFLGRLTWVKGVQNLVQSFPLILKNHSNSKMVILGKGEEQEHIIETAKRLGIQDKIISLFDFVSEEKRILHYAASDVCIFPSIYEPFGIVSLEAMAMEKPVVVGAHGVVGFKEQVISSGSNQCGIHINGNNPADIAWGVNVILDKSDKAKKWGINARERVLDYFTWEKVSDQTLGIYQSILNK